MGSTAGGGLRRPTVAVIVEFTNTKLVVTEDTTNWFLLIKKNLFSLELWSFSIETSGRLISSLDDESIDDEGGSKSKSKRSFEVGRSVAIKLNNRKIN